MIEKIINAKEEDIDELVKNKINDLNSNADKIEKLGFTDYINSNPVYKGFIPLNTRIRYSNYGMEDYSMKTTDFIYEFIHYIKKYNLGNKFQIIYFLEYFINSYFGLPGNISREAIFNDIAWKTTTTDDEYFEALEKNEIGMLKNKGAAQCTERSAIAEQILSILDFEVFYCMGCVDLGNNQQEPHCFNIVKRKNDYTIVDYSCPIREYNEDNSTDSFYPFIAIISNDEFIDFLNNGTIKNFPNYRYEIKNGKSIRVNEDNNRLYVVGQYKIQKDNQK